MIWDLHESKADDVHHADGKGNVKTEDTDTLWQHVNRIDQQLQQLKATQQYLYWRERRHRQTVSMC